MDTTADGMLAAPSAARRRDLAGLVVGVAVGSAVFLAACYFLLVKSWPGEQIVSGGDAPSHTVLLTRAVESAVAAAVLVPALVVARYCRGRLDRTARGTAAVIFAGLILGVVVAVPIAGVTNSIAQNKLTAAADASAPKPAPVAPELAAVMWQPAAFGGVRSLPPHAGQPAGCAAQYGATAYAVQIGQLDSNTLVVERLNLFPTASAAAQYLEVSDSVRCDPSSAGTHVKSLSLAAGAGLPGASARAVVSFKSVYVAVKMRTGRIAITILIPGLGNVLPSPAEVSQALHPITAAAS